MDCSDEWACDERRGSYVSMRSDRKTTSSFEHDTQTAETLDVKKQEEKLILQAMIATQVNNRYFNQNAPHLKYRETVVLWLIDTVKKLNYKNSTMHSTIAYFDAISSLSLINLEQVKLVAFVCMYLAAKLEQKHAEIPTISDCLALFENQFSWKDFETCEALIFKMLKYRLNVITPFHFLSYFLTQEVIFEEDLELDQRANLSALAQRFAEECVLLLKASLLNYDFYRYTSLAVAAGILAAVRSRFNLKVAWNKSLEELTMVSYESIGSCAFTFLELLEKESAQNPTAARLAATVSDISH